jgi:hypothetical protein
MLTILGAIWCAMSGVDQALRIVYWQWPQDQRIDQRESSRARPGGERQGEHCRHN